MAKTSYKILTNNRLRAHYNLIRELERMFFLQELGLK